MVAQDVLSVMKDDSSASFLKLTSHNCRWLRDSSRIYIESLLSKCDILYLREHRLSSEQLRLLSSISTKHLAKGVCGFNNVDILKGGPYGDVMYFGDII